MSEERTIQPELNRLVTIVIPTLNEEEAIEKVLEELFSLGLRNVMIIDGYSSDRTVEVAQRYPVTVILQHGKGKGGAISTAVEHVNTPYMLVMDGDFTYDPSCVGRFMQHIHTYDEIIGARPLDNKLYMTRLHKFGNEIITKTFNMLMGTNLSDVCSGMYMLRTERTKDIHLSTTSFDVEAEIAAQIASSGKITQVPINYRQRMGKQKLSTWRHGFKILNSVVKLAKSYNPGVFYSIIGTIALLFSITTFANAFIEWSNTHTFPLAWFLMGISILLVVLQLGGISVQARSLRQMEQKIIERSEKNSNLMNR
jgi:dolichol-phosphate hexosyltransferase